MIADIGKHNIISSNAMKKCEIIIIGGEGNRTPVQCKLPYKHLQV